MSTDELLEHARQWLKCMLVINAAVNDGQAYMNLPEYKECTKHAFAVKKVGYVIGMEGDTGEERFMLQELDD